MGLIEEFQTKTPPLTTVQEGVLPLPVEHYSDYMGEGWYVSHVLRNLTGKWQLLYINGRWHVRVQRKLFIPFFTRWVGEEEIFYKVPEVSITYTCGT